MGIATVLLTVLALLFGGHALFLEALRWALIIALGLALIGSAAEAIDADAAVPGGLRA